MEKFLIWLACVFVIIVGAPNVVTCVEYIFDRTGVIGSPNQLEKEELQDNCQGYTITYNLGGGTLAKDNPQTYSLFTVDFTLENPTKEGFEFVGWTGSNGSEPELTITIGQGSCGDLEFTANFVISIDVDLSLNETGLSWTLDERADEYKVFINDVQKTSLQGESSVDIETLNSFCSDGENAIKVVAMANDIEVGSATIDYVYYNTSSFENLTLSPIYFSRLSDGYEILNGTVQLKYSYTGRVMREIYKNDTILDWSHEDAMLYGLNTSRTCSKLSFVDFSMYELMELINNAYTGNTTSIIDLSGKLQYQINDTFQTVYVPTDIKLQVTYDTMFSEVSFYEGATVDIGECATSNSLAVGFGGYSGQSTFCTEIMLKDTSGKTWKFVYYDNFEQGTTVYQIGNTEYSSETINSNASELKFYLNADYYFTINGNMTDLLLALYQDARTNRDAYEVANGNTSPKPYNIWSYDTTYYTLNLSEYFTVYSSDGTKVAFDYELKVEYKAMRYI